MLRFRYLASHKNNLIIDDFRWWSSDYFFLHESADIEMLT